MESDTIITIILFLNTVSILIVVLLLFLTEYAKPEKPLTAVGMLTEARSRANTILHTATMQARKIIADAEIKGTSLIAKEKLDSKKLHTEYNKQLKKLSRQVTKHFEDSTKKAEETYRAYVKTLETSLAKTIRQDKETLESNASLFFERTKTVVDKLMAEIHDKMMANVDRKLSQTNQAIEEYHKHQIRTIDENIIDIVEKTTTITLGKTLSLSDHTDLLYKALEQAKKEVFFTDY